METNLSFWRDLEKFSQKSVPRHTFLRCGDYLEFLKGLGKFRQKGVASHTFFRRADYLEFLRGLGKFRQKGVTSYTFFRRADYLEFLMGLGKFRQKAVTSCTFLAVQTIASFWWDLEKISQRSVPSYTLCSLWRLTWVFDGTWKNFHKTCAQLHVLFAVETILSFEWDFEKFRQKCVPSYTFSQRRLSWVFEGTWKVSTKRCDQLHIFFAVQTILSFWWDLESFDKKLWPVAPFSQCRLS